MSITRRTFLQAGTLGLISVCLNQSDFLTLAAQAATISPRQAGKSKVLVVVQLSGGNDGLNTVIPYGLGQYYQVRPTLAVQPNEVIALTGQIGLNPNLDGLGTLYKNGQVAVLQGVGYPQPNRSHFRSMEIWQTACPDAIANDGWLGKYLDYASVSGRSNELLPAVNVDPLLPKTLVASKVVVPSVNNVYDFRFKTDPRFMQDRAVQLSAFQDIYQNFNLSRPEVELLRDAGLDASKASDYLLKVVRNYHGDVNYPRNSFSDGLKFIAQMIAGGVSASVYNISLGSFDTHANQKRTQNNLLKQLSDGLVAFQTDLEQHGVDKDVLVMCFSEFGRRVAENGGRGTDHGTAEPMFIVGSSVVGGIYGNHPSLINLDQGDLHYQIDFRSVYATMLDRWLGADSRQVLGGNFDDIGFVKTT